MALSIFHSAGGLLAANQTLAWAEMLWQNIHKDSAVEAVKKTFSGKHPCGRCHEIANHEAEKASKPVQEVERRFDPFQIPRADFQLHVWFARNLKWLAPESSEESIFTAPSTPPPKFA